MPEILVSILILLIGTLATLSLVSSSNTSLSQTRAREAAVNLARELLESAHDTPYAQVGETNWFRDTLEDTSGQTGSISGGSDNSQRTTIQRRGVGYAVAVSSCSVDDPSDGYGAHPAGGDAWCTDSATTGTQDGQAEDFKRVATGITWSFHQRSQPTLVQTATFAANGAAIGPTVTDLSITSPSGLSPTQPVITNPGTTTVTFLGTSVGANDMKFSVDGVEQAIGTNNQGNGSWRFQWNISQLTDGLYTIGAIAVDALGARGAPRTIQVRLARGAPMAPQRVTGDYNYLYVSGSRTLAVELAWDANPEGNVTGYEVLKGSTVICSASLAVSCIDLSPAASGSTAYTVKTLYNDASGNPGSVSTAYNVTAPANLPPSFVGNIGQASCDPTSMTITTSSAVAVGNRVVVRLETRGGSNAAVSASDSRGNSYTTDLDHLNIDQRMVVFSANVGTGLVAGDTITVTYPDARSAGVVADVLSNVASTSPVDVTGTGSGNSSSPSASATTTNPADLLLGAVSIANTLTPTQPSGWSGLTSQGLSCGGGSNGNSTNVGGYRAPGSTGTFAYSPIMSNSGRWAAAVVAYKPGGATSFTPPETPTGLSVTANGDGTRTLTWTAPSGTPAVEFYRIYRDGRNYTDRIDTAGATASSVTWTDTNAGGTSHTYRVTAASATLIESDFAGPVTG